MVVVGVQSRCSPGGTRGKSSVAAERSRLAFCGRPPHLGLVFDDTLGDSQQPVTESTEGREGLSSRLSGGLLRRCLYTTEE